jgi:hypothetical protein
MIRVYAFADGLRSLPEGVERVELGSLTAIVTRGAEPEPIVHGRIVESLVEHAAAVLPVRFGEELPDDRALARLVGEREGALLEALERVRGCVEIGLRVWGDRAAADRLHARLAALARESRVRRAGDDELVTAYLVPRGLVPAIQDEVARALAEPLAPTVL